MNETPEQLAALAKVEEAIVELARVMEPEPWTITNSEREVPWSEMVIGDWFVTAQFHSLNGDIDDDGEQVNFYWSWAAPHMQTHHKAGMAGQALRRWGG